MTDDPGFGIKHEKHCPTKHQRGHPWHPGYKCPGCAAIRAAVAEKVGCSHEAELTKLRSLVMERDRRHTLLEEADTEIADRREQVEALQQLLDEITVASGAGIVCRPIDLPVFISNMKAALTVADEMAAWVMRNDYMFPGALVTTLLTRFHAAREKVGK